MSDDTNDRVVPLGNFFLDADQGNKLWNHVRALETMDEEIADIREDRKARKEIAKADGFDPNILDLIVKRRKIGHGQTLQVDTLTRLYEDALKELGVKPLEETKKAREADERRTPEEIAADLHGDEPDRTMFN